MASYLAEPPIPIYQSALIWWKANCNRWPRIAKLAREMLCIPASSVPCERVFSGAGLVISSDRARLKPKTAEALIVLRQRSK